MGSVLLLKTDQEPETFGDLIDGEKLGAALDELDSLAYELGVKPLSEFVTVSDEDLDDYFDEEEMGVDHDLVDDSHDENIVWFKAHDGLNALAPVIRYLEENGGEITDQPSVLQDLQRLEEGLENAKKRGIHWHFGVAE